MGAENLNPLEELKSLERQLGHAADLAALRPIFYRLEEIARQHSGDFEVQLVANEIKQRLVSRGTQMRERQPRREAPRAAPPRAKPNEVRPTPPPRPPRSPLNWKRALLLGALAGSILSIALIAFLVNQARKRNREAPDFTVAGSQPAAVSPAPAPPAQTVRILTDLDQGSVVLDDRPPADLQEGQLILDGVAPGTHTVKLTGKNGDASFSFEMAGDKPPAPGFIAVHNLTAVLVSSLGSQARVLTNAPVKVALNGQPQGEAGPEGLELQNFQPGVDEIVIGEGKDQRNMKESFGPGPMLTAFLKSDVNSGTLIVSTGENDVRVFLNNKEYRKRTQRGQVRIPALGAVTVRVAKDGFEETPPQTAELKKGAEVRLEFPMKPLPKVAVLRIRGSNAGAEVWLDQKSIGTVGADGAFSDNAVPPGDHTIEIRRDQYIPKKIQRAFKAGETVALSSADVALLPSNATIRLARTPAGAAVTYRRADDAEAHEAQGNQLELPAGSYVFLAKSPGYVDRSETVQVAGGETRSLDFTLARVPVSVPIPPPAAGIADFEDPSAWKREGDSWVHKGSGFIPFKLPPKGVFTFTAERVKGGIFRGGRVRWCVQYVDAKNYLLYEIDRKNFWAGVVEKGTKYEREKKALDLENVKTLTIRIEVTPDRLIHKIRMGGDWVTLDSFSEPGRNFTRGKFGFLAQGNEEIDLSDFQFMPK